MAQSTITVDTRSYVRSHGINPHAARPCKGMWAFTIDDQEGVSRQYGTYKAALAWATAQAVRTVQVLP